MYQKNDQVKLTFVQQSFLDAYHEFFFEIQGCSDINDLLQSIPQAILQYHKVQILHPDSLLFNKISKFDDIYLDVRKQTYNGLIYLYDLILGYFHLRISLLNFDRNADEKDNEIENNRIGMGGFGSVRVCQVEGKEFAIKRIYFKSKVQQTKSSQSQAFMDFETSRAKFTQIKRAIRQYSVYKICSMLEIGPKIIFQQNFDLHCYNDCIEFYMELCDVPCKSHNFFLEKDISHGKFSKDLKTALLKMHSLKLIHRDIKPENILYSSDKNSFMLTDFGMTHPVNAQIWQQTLTTYSGTLKYSSQDMMNLYHLKRQGMVNLYMNDIHSLNVVLEEFKEISFSSHQNANNYDVSLMSRNSMSFAESYSNQYSYGAGSMQNSQQEDSDSIVDSIINTGSSVPVLPTNNTNSLIGPVKYSSQINFYQASVISLIANKYLCNPLKNLKIQDLSNIVQKIICLAPKEESIKAQVIYHLNYIFFPQHYMDFRKQCKLTVQKNYLTFRLRGYGPDSGQVLQVLRNIGQLNSIEQKRNNQVFTLQKIFQTYQERNGNIEIDEKDVQMTTTLHKSRSSISKFKYMLKSINYKLSKDDKYSKQISQKTILNFLIECLKIMADTSCVLLQEDMKEITKMIESFISKLKIIHEENERIQQNKDSQLSETIDMITKEYQKLIQNDKMSFGKVMFKNKLHGQRFQKFHLLLLILRCLNFNNEFRQQNEVFLVLKYIFYVVIKNFNDQQNPFGKVSRYIRHYGQRVVKRQQKQIKDNFNCSRELLDSFVKNIYFLAKFNYLCKKKETMILEILSIIDRVKSQINGLTLKLYDDVIDFYRDYIVELKLCAFYSLNRAEQAQRQVSVYFNNLMSRQNTSTIERIESQGQQKIPVLNWFENLDKMMTIISKNHQTTLIQKVTILKIIADIKLTSQQNLQEIKTIYEICYKTISQNYTPINFHKILFQIVNNLCFLLIRMNDWMQGMKWVEHWYRFLKENQLVDSQREVAFTCKCFFQCLLGFQLIRGDSLDLKDKTEQEIELIQHYNNLLPQVIDTYIKTKIKVLIKYCLVQKISWAKKIKYRNLLNIQIKLQQLTTIYDKYHPNYEIFHENPQKYNRSMGCKNIEQVIEIKKIFLAQYKENLPFMEWNYRQVSLEMGFHYYQQHHYLICIEYLWNYVEQLFKVPSQCSNTDFEYCITFVELLTKTNCSHRRALKFLKKFIFYIPPSEFLTRKKAYFLYCKINSELQSQNNIIQLKWIKEMCKNNYELLLSRKFQLLLEFEQQPILKFVNALCRKWIKKL